MLTLKEYASIAENYVHTLQLPSSPAGLYDPIRYALDCGGKRLRPTLVIAVAEALGLTAEDVKAQALAVEMFHNFTLLHDDVMDNADVRRGRPTVHRRWDDRTAILSGDAMLTIAGQLMERCNANCRDESVKLMNRTAMEVYEGQQLDMDFETKEDVSVEDYMEMIRLKTSVLLGCACALGAIAGGAEENVVKAFYGYGEKLGLAFQLQDDFLDTYGDPMIFGKEIGGDIVNDKKTWLRIMARANDSAGIIDAETLHPSEPKVKIERVRSVYNSLNLPDQCRTLIKHYVDEAIKEVQTCGLDFSAEKFFTDLALSTINRNH